MSRGLTAEETARFQGFLNIHKPSGVTSRRAVDRTLRLLRECGVRRRDLPKAGHAGTLDPLASGVLVVCLGSATRLIDLLHQQPKSYRAAFRFGCRSNTDDIKGDVVEVDPQRAAVLTREELDAALIRFRGPIAQIPPAFSAVKIEGKPAYQLARRGHELDLQPKMVTIHSLEVIRFEPPDLEVDVVCSSGTYIRSLGRDLGEQLGCGAIMTSLCRTQAGPFDLSESWTWGEMTSDELPSRLQQCASVTRHLRSYVCNPVEQDQLAHGVGVAPRDEAWQSRLSDDTGSPTEQIALLDQSGELIALGGWDDRQPLLRPRINFIGIS